MGLEYADDAMFAAVFGSQKSGGYLGRMVRIIVHDGDPAYLSTRLSTLSTILTIAQSLDFTGIQGKISLLISRLMCYTLSHIKDTIFY